MEYVVGPILALLIGMKFTDYRAKQNLEAITKLQAQQTAVEKQLVTAEQELPKRLMTTVLPVAKAVAKLNEQVGL